METLSRCLMLCDNTCVPLIDSLLGEERTWCFTHTYYGFTSQPPELKVASSKFVARIYNLEYFLVNVAHGVLL